MSGKREITRADILSMAEYEKVRRQLRAEVIAVKRDRRVMVGPYATFHFENYQTMWQQIHEMLYIEKGGDEQIGDELRAYNPLIPQGRELIATMMIEIEDPVIRARELAKMGGIEETISLDIGGDIVKAVPEGDIERTKEDGKTSSVHFLHFPLNERQIAAFRDPAVRVMLGITHPAYGHLAVLPAATKQALAKDFA